MKKISILVVALLLLSSLSTAALAASRPVDPLQQSIIEVLPSTGEPTVTEEEAPEAGILPDSPFYFLKRFIEQIQLTFTFDDQAKAEMLFEFAERRIAELEALPQEKQAQYLESLLDAFLAAVEKADELLEPAEPAEEAVEPEEGIDLEDGDDGLVEETDADLPQEEEDAELEEEANERNSLRVLRRVYEQVPEQGKKGIERAIEVQERKAQGLKPGPNRRAPGQQKKVQEQEPPAPDDTKEAEEVESQNAPPKPGNSNSSTQRKK